MSWELHAVVTRVVDGEMLDRALRELRAPFDGPGNLTEQRGTVAVEFTLAGMEGEIAGYFGHWYSPEPRGSILHHDGRAVVGQYTLLQHLDDVEDVAWTVAAALAKAGDGYVEDPRTKRRPPWKSIVKRIERYRTNLERQCAALSEEEKAVRRRRPDESALAHRDRVWLRRADDEHVAIFLRKRLYRAISEDDRESVDWLCRTVPAKKSLVEAFLDPAFRAGREDLGESIATRFQPADLRAHFLEACQCFGGATDPYLQFLAGLPSIRSDTSLLAKAFAVVKAPDVREWLALAHLGVAAPRSDEEA